MTPKRMLEAIYRVMQDNAGLCLDTSRDRTALADALYESLEGVTIVKMTNNCTRDHLGPSVWNRLPKCPRCVDCDYSLATGN